MAGRPKAPVPVTWRDGIHVTGTPIWCDALRTRDICFVSNAHALSTSRHGQLIASAATLALLGAPHTGTRLPVPYGRPFTLGAVRLELIRSGHGLGGASLLLHVDGYRVLYCGAVCPQGGGLGGPAESRACDALVVDARYGDPSFAFPAVAEAVENVVDFVRQTTAAGGCAALLVSSPSKALDVAARLNAHWHEHLDVGARPTIFAQRAIYDALQRLRTSQPELPSVRRYGGRMPVGHIVMWLAHRRAQLPVQTSANMRVALVSGAAAHASDAPGIDAAIAWSDRADYRGLLAYIDACHPRRLFLTGERGESLAALLDRPDRPCTAIGPPRQIELFRAQQ